MNGMMTPEDGLSPVGAEVLAAWSEAIGASHVVAHPEELERASRTTFATQGRVQAILRPAHATDVAACLTIASRYGVALYPVSRGTNWGLGGRVPPRGKAFLLDLSRMHRIRSYDPVLGTLSLEPGVTFLQVYEFLRDQGSDFWLSPIGGSDLSSVLGNALERGEGAGPLGERSNHVAGLEVVTANGQVLRTGFSRFEGAQTSGLSRHGVGPSLDGLFAQSNLGVVTQMTVWLSKQPRYQLRFKGRFRDAAHLSQGLDALRELHQQRVLTDCGFTVWNLHKFLALNGRYPWTRTAGATPFRLFPQVDMHPAYVSGHLHAASAEIGQAMLQQVQETLRLSVDDWDSEEITAAQRQKDPRLDVGYPNPVNLKTAYWRKRGVPNGPDPEADGCGVIWLCPALPFKGALIAEVFQALETMGYAHRLETQIGLSAMSPRLVHAYISLIYDRDVPGEDERAMACHDEMLAWLLERGLPPYRLGIHSMEAMGPKDDGYAQLLRGLRRQLDPAGIIAPGRYVD